eukprot:scaffold35770_cov101-Isochrysis_galbana.AAC.3
MCELELNPCRARPLRGSLRFRNRRLAHCNRGITRRPQHKRLLCRERLARHHLLGFHLPPPLVGQRGHRARLLIRCKHARHQVATLHELRLTCLDPRHLGKAESHHRLWELDAPRVDWSGRQWREWRPTREEVIGRGAEHRVGGAHPKRGAQARLGVQRIARLLGRSGPTARASRRARGCGRRRRPTAARPTAGRRRQSSRGERRAPAHGARGGKRRPQAALRADTGGTRRSAGPNWRAQWPPPRTSPPRPRRRRAPTGRWPRPSRLLRRIGGTSAPGTRESARGDRSAGGRAGCCGHAARRAPNAAPCQPSRDGRPRCAAVAAESATPGCGACRENAQCAEGRLAAALRRAEVTSRAETPFDKAGGALRDSRLRSRQAHGKTRSAAAQPAAAPRSPPPPRDALLALRAPSSSEELLPAARRLCGCPRCAGRAVRASEARACHPCAWQPSSGRGHRRRGARSRALPCHPQAGARARSPRRWVAQSGAFRRRTRGRGGRIRASKRPGRCSIPPASEAA